MIFIAAKTHANAQGVAKERGLTPKEWTYLDHTDRTRGFGDFTLITAYRTPMEIPAWIKTCMYLHLSRGYRVALQRVWL